MKVQDCDDLPELDPPILSSTLLSLSCRIYCQPSMDLCCFECYCEVESAVMLVSEDRASFQAQLLFFAVLSTDYL